MRIDSEQRLQTARGRLVAALERAVAFPAEARDELVTLTSWQRFSRGSYLLRGGQLATDGFFVVRGLVRELYIDERGDEHTRAFVAEDQFTGSLLDLLSGRPAITFIEALEDVEVLAFAYEAFDALCLTHPALERLARRLAEQLYVRKAKREHDMLALSARQRYDAWRTENATIDTRIKRQHLASYLGITPEHLSRLRRS